MKTLSAEIDEWLKSTPKEKGCPYGDPPEIVKQSDTEWTINGLPRIKGDSACTIIMMDANACATCPLAVREPAEPMSPLLRHLCFLSTLQDAGAQIPFDYLTLMEWKGLAMLKAKSQEKQFKEMKEKRR